MIINVVLLLLLAILIFIYVQSGRPVEQHKLPITTKVIKTVPTLTISPAPNTHNILVDKFEAAFAAENIPNARYYAQLAAEVVQRNQELIDVYLEMLAIAEKKIT